MVQHDDFTRPGHGEFDDVADHYDRLMSDVPYHRWVDYVELLLQRWDHQPETVLDLACGTGKVGSEFLKRGYSGMGVDLSEPMVRYCKTQDPSLPALVADASALGIADQQFDLVVSLYDSLNYILKPKALAEAIAEAYRVLNSGGLFIFDMNTIRALSAGLFNQSNLDSNAPLRYSWEAHWDRRRRICRVDMIYYWDGDDGQKHFRETHYQRAYEKEQILTMLEMAGFSDYEALTGYTFRPLTSGADRAYYIAYRE
ncbi:MAG: class I SAM-dependent methyltransferase [Armatimonadota bacterium]